SSRIRTLDRRTNPRFINLLRPRNKTVIRRTHREQPSRNCYRIPRLQGKPFLPWTAQDRPRKDQWPRGASRQGRHTPQLRRRRNDPSNPPTSPLRSPFRERLTASKETHHATPRTRIHPTSRMARRRSHPRLVASYSRSPHRPPRITRGLLFCPRSPHGKHPRLRQPQMPQTLGLIPLPPPLRQPRMPLVDLPRLPPRQRRQRRRPTIRYPIQEALMTLKYNDRNHSYYLDGKRVPGVTGILNGGIPKPAISRWPAKTVAEYVADNLHELDNWSRMGRDPLIAALKQVPWTARDEAAVRGTDVH